MDFAHTFSKPTGFCFVVFNKDYTLTLKIYSFGPKIAFKAFCTRKDSKSFVKINFLVTFLHF